MRSCNTRFVTEMCLWPSHEIVSHLFAILFSPMTNLSHSFNSFFVVCDIYGVKMKTCVNIKVIIFWLNIVAEFFVRRSVQTSAREREFAQQGMSRTVFWHVRWCRESSEVHNLQKSADCLCVKRSSIEDEQIIDSTGFAGYICVIRTREVNDLSERLTHFGWKYSH